jgi:hypothetical protein
MPENIYMSKQTKQTMAARQNPAYLDTSAKGSPYPIG